MLKRTEHPLGKEGHGVMQNLVYITGEGEGLTQGGYKCKVLQHYIMVQASLSLIKETPFLLGEVHSNILKGHTTLSRMGWINR